MKKGQIIKKMSNDGTPYGPLMMIRRATQTRVDACYIDPESNISVSLDKNHVYECHTIMLDVSAYDLVHILEKNPDVFYHKPNQQWTKASYVGWSTDVVILHNRATGTKVYYTDCVIERIMKRNFDRSTYKTQVSLVPVIRITLGRRFYTSQR